MAPLAKYVNVTQEVQQFCQKRLVFCQFEMSYIIFEVYTVSVTIHVNIQLIRLSYSITHTVLLPLHIVFLGPEKRLWEQAFQRLVTFAFQPQLA